MIRPSQGYAFHKGRPTNWVQATVVAGPMPAIPGLDAAALDAFLSLGGFVDADEEAAAQGIIELAVEMVYNFTGYEPIERQITVKWDVHPLQSRFYGGVRPTGGLTKPWINLPRRPVQTVDAIRVGDVLLDADDFESELDGNPPRVATIGIGTGGIEMDLTVGVPAGNPIDPRFKQAVLCAAAYLYENRGCKWDSALKHSGAASISRPLRVAVGGL